MRIFLAGASGALGTQLLPQLAADGHTVVAATRTPAKTSALRDAGAEPVVMDGLDARAVRDAVLAAEPDVVIHQMTALSSFKSLRRFDRDFALTNRLRTEGTDNLLTAAIAAGAKRFIAQSYSGWPNPRTGSLLKDESDGLDPSPVSSSRATLAAIRHVETVVPAASELDGIVLRYGSFYGPGNTLGKGGEMLELVRKRQLPVVGSGAGMWSFIHIRDAARATVAALTNGTPGVYNVVDDEPAPVSEWLPYLASAVGAKPPRHVPAWLVRPMLGAQGVMMMTTARGSSNAKAKRELGWAPEYASWRDGFQTGLG